MNDFTRTQAIEELMEESAEHGHVWNDAGAFERDNADLIAERVIELESEAC